MIICKDWETIFVFFSTIEIKRFREEWHNYNSKRIWVMLLSLSGLLVICVGNMLVFHVEN